MTRGTLVIVPCGSSKIWDKTPDAGSTTAADAYTGTPFKINRQYAERFGDAWIVLSAKYGFIDPDFLIPGPYNVTFKRAKSGPIDAESLKRQVEELDLHSYSTVVGLGGVEYRKAILAAFAPFGTNPVFPFEGMPLGKMLQATRRAIDAGTPGFEFLESSTLRVRQLAVLIDKRNAIDAKIARIIGRPAHSGHIGEYVAAAIFDIELNPSASAKGHDGQFRSGPLAGRSVNIKYGTRRDGNLNLAHSPDPADHPAYYLVLTGPTIGAVSSKGLTAPWVIHAVYLFDSKPLVEHLTHLGRTPGVATSVRKEQWDTAMVFPEPNNRIVTLSIAQREMLDLFGGSANRAPHGIQPAPRKQKL